ncbi:hypothetical protein PUN28_009764 [Cardiocondyla obscurior]|uniref:Uncharacterized protein n=1 Tax=Cardiocondyla obscurior TaxID=286306 RepID=A0AAW2FR53_9HYME
MVKVPSGTESIHKVLVLRRSFRRRSMTSLDSCCSLRTSILELGDGREIESSSPRESTSSQTKGKGSGEREEEQTLNSPSGNRESEMREELGVYKGVVGRNCSDPGSVDCSEKLVASSWSVGE